MILELVLAVIFVEAVTEIVVASKIAQGPRAWAYFLNKWLGELIHCGYCTSVWVSASVAWLVNFGFTHPVVEYFLALFVIHRLSNLWHEFVVRYLQRAPFSFHLLKTERVVINEDLAQEESNEEEPSPSTTEGPGEEFFAVKETDRIIQD